jgi:hypothetical protein
MTTGGKVGLGCAALPVILVIAAVAFFGHSSSAPPPQPPPAHTATPLVAPDTPELRAKLRETVYPLVRAAEAAGDHEKALDILQGGVNPARPAWFTEESDYKRLDAKLEKEVIKVREKRAREGAIKLAQARAAGRQLYARNLREHFLDKGMDIKVSVTGRNADRLYLRFVLFNDVWTHNFGKGDLINEIQAAGFKRVDLDSGFDYHSYFTLHPAPDS